MINWIQQLNDLKCTHLRSYDIAMWENYKIYLKQLIRELRTWYRLPVYVQLNLKYNLAIEEYKVILWWTRECKTSRNFSILMRVDKRYIWVIHRKVQYFQWTTNFFRNSFTKSTEMMWTIFVGRLSFIFIRKSIYQKWKNQSKIFIKIWEEFDLMFHAVCLWLDFHISHI